MNTSAQPETLPEPAERLSPLQLLTSLYFRPSHLFADITPLKAKPAFLIVAWIAGITSAIDRFDVNLVRSELMGRATPTAFLMDSWLAFWPFILAVGAVYAAMVWLIGGWWYRMRLSWAGAANPDPFAARIVYIHQDLVVGLPAVISTVIQTFVFESYRAAWASDEAWSGLLIIFIGWSCIASYKAVRAAFAVGKWKARFWFLILPMGFYLAVGVFAGAMYAMREM
jgi:hypothetical protein